jgi:hypothetical protein
MKTALMIAALALAGTGAALRPAYAAHAGAPYTNVNHANDAGNDTGDSMVDQLNAQQLNPGAPAAPAQPITPQGAPMGSGKAVGAH